MPGNDKQPVHLREIRNQVLGQTVGEILLICITAQVLEPQDGDLRGAAAAVGVAPQGRELHPVAQPAPDDKRFKDDLWVQNYVFDFIKQCYLLAARHVQDSVSMVQGLDEQTSRKVAFYTRQVVDAMSPTNFVLTNPEVFNETVKSGGQNLLKGFSNLLEDIERGDGKLRRVRAVSARTQPLERLCDAHASSQGP